MKATPKTPERARRTNVATPTTAPGLKGRSATATTLAGQPVKRSLEPTLKVAGTPGAVAAGRPKVEGSAEDGGEVSHMRAVVRVRPLQKRGLESSADMQRDLTVSGASVLTGTGSHAFHRCFEKEDNAGLFAVEGAPLVHSVISGFNGTLVAYGQTGSGKTHTMGGVKGDEGMMPRMLQRLFEEIEKQRLQFEYEVSLQYLQVYNEQIFDLLSDSKTAAETPLSIVEEKDSMSVKGAHTVELRRAEDGLKALADGQHNQKIASTAMNRASSRAHTIALITVIRRNALALDSLSGDDMGAQPSAEAVGEAATGEDEASPESILYDAEKLREKTVQKIERFLESATSFSTLRAKLTMVDLAGSERVGRTGAAGQTLKEAKNINASLLALGTVINLLAQSSAKRGPVQPSAKPHIPFRNSTLTRLLQESFGGNCRTSILVCCSPAKSDAAETKAALLFGQRAMLVKNSTKQNATVDNKTLASQLQAQLAAAEKCLEEAQKKAQLHAVRTMILATRLRRCVPTAVGAPRASTAPCHTAPCLAAPCLTDQLCQHWRTLGVPSPPASLTHARRPLPPPFAPSAPRH